MKLTSSAFDEGADIPSRYTCDGTDEIPPFKIDDVPSEAKSLVMICHDPDSPSGNWDHWIAFDIPPETREIKSEVGTRGMNSWPRLGYGGPCPTRGEHRYIFELFALDKFLGFAEGATRSQIEHAISGHVIAKAQLMGKYIKIENR